MTYDSDRDVSQVNSVMPVNASPFERAYEHAARRLLGRLAPPFPQLLDPQKTPAAFLAYLASDRGVSEWQASDDEPRKRAAVALALPIKRMAGTRAALTHAIESMGYRAEITPWHAQTPRGQPYSFKVVSRTSAGFSEHDFNRLEARLADAKAERDVLFHTITAESHGTAYVSATVYSGAEITVFPARPKVTRVSATPTLGASATSPNTCTTVYPAFAVPSYVDVQRHVAATFVSPDTRTTIYPE